MDQPSSIPTITQTVTTIYGSTLFSIPTITQTVTTGRLKRVDPYIVVTVCVIVGILEG
jgi:hypothetical protein